MRNTPIHDVEKHETTIAPERRLPNGDSIRIRMRRDFHGAWILTDDGATTGGCPLNERACRIVGDVFPGHDVLIGRTALVRDITTSPEPVKAAVERFAAAMVLVYHLSADPPTERER